MLFETSHCKVRIPIFGGTEKKLTSNLQYSITEKNMHENKK